MNERPIPPAALVDENAVELLRVWVAQKKLQSSMKIGMYSEMGMDESAAWGTILADTARHISQALTKDLGGDEVSFLARLQSQFNAELVAPTSKVSGAFIAKD